MDNLSFNKSRVIRYLVWTFAIAYGIQFGVSLLYGKGLAAVGQLVMAAMMFVPTLGVVLAGGKLKGLGWDPRFRQNLRPILHAWFLPAVLTALGAGLFFLIFPGRFDLSGSLLGPELLAQLEAQGLSYPLYILISAVASVTYAPLINTFVALGEEIGWRGFLYPQLKARFGRRKGLVLGGVIWGAWHWPLIWLIGYEYGFDYVGFPVLGMLLFCLFTVALGIWCDRLYERSGSIWLPALLHGAINAAAGLPLTVYLAGADSFRLLGPAPNGLIAGLPMLILAAVYLLRGEKKPAEKA